MVRALIAPLLAFITATTVTAASRFLSGVNYNTRIGPDWASVAERCKSDADIDADLAILATVTSNIRTYGLVDCNQGAAVLKAAKQNGLQVDLGLWVSDNDQVFLDEKARFQELVASGLITNDLVSAIHVGSEAIYRGDVTPDVNIQYMNEIKAITTEHALGIPITITDIGDVYLDHTDTLIGAVDFVSANGFPFWEQKPVVGAAVDFKNRMDELMKKTANASKEFVISETGWASNGVNVNASIASPQNAAQYFKEFVTLAFEQQWKYYYFEAFDEPWKIQLNPNNTVEGYFGIFYENRTMKSEILALVDSLPRGNHELVQAPTTSSPTGVPSTTTPSPTIVLGTTTNMPTPTVSHNDHLCESA